MPDEMASKAIENPPRCIMGFGKDPADSILELIENREENWVYFGLRCGCGEAKLNVMGYEAESQSYPGTRVFIGPLALDCLKCGKTTELMDPRKDGYNGEINSNCTMTGDGPRDRYRCPDCAGDVFHVAVSFEYTVEEDELDDEPEMAQRIQDYFTWFCVYGKCDACEKFLDITDFECA